MVCRSCFYQHDINIPLVSRSVLQVFTFLPALFFNCIFNGVPQNHVSADTQLDPSCVSALLATNVDLFACFAECLFKSSSISC